MEQPARGWTVADTCTNCVKTSIPPAMGGGGGRAGCLDYPALSTPNISVQKYRGDNGVRPYVGEVEEMMCVVSVTTGAY